MRVRQMLVLFLQAIHTYHPSVPIRTYTYTPVLTSKHSLIHASKIMTWNTFTFFLHYSIIPFASASVIYKVQYANDKRKRSYSSNTVRRWKIRALKNACHTHHRTLHEVYIKPLYRNPSRENSKSQTMRPRKANAPAPDEIASLFARIKKA